MSKIVKNLRRATHRSFVADDDVAGVAAPRDIGASFIEMLVAVVILGTAGVAVLTALAAAATGASTHRDVARAQQWLASAGDAIADVNVDADQYVPCAQPGDYQPIVESIRSADAPAITVTEVEYWTAAQAFDPSHANCDGATGHYATGQRLQRVTLEATIDGVARSLTVVKRPALEPTVDIGPAAPGGGSGTGSVTPDLTPGL